MSHDCLSFNYGEKEESQGLYTCQLNYCTKKDRLVLVDRKFEYYEMVREPAAHERDLFSRLAVSRDA